MAYGLKYELLFSDVNLNRRRIQIFKKDYAGAVYPMIGTNDPISIEWLTDDDIYEPIIGSVAEVNLMVTDSVTYDNFYEYGEIEYQLVLQFEESAGSFATYWKGFITNDIYSEAIITTPYTLSIRATDGLGSLDGFDCWYPETGENTQILWKYLYKCLELTGLNFDIWISCDLRYTTSSWENIFNQVSIHKESVFKDNYTIRDAKEVLRSILMAFNCRIFQSYGRWYIVNSSTYGDQRIIAGIQNGTYSGSGILTAKQGFLNSGSEDIKYYIYNYSGSLIGNTTTNMLKTIPTNTTPVHSNMVRSIKRPVRKYQEDVDIAQKQVDYNYNASFEFLAENWNFPNGVTIVDNPFSGKKAIQQTLTTIITNTGTELAFNSTGALSCVKNTESQFLISVKCTVPNGSRIPFYLKIFDGTNNWYFIQGADTDWGTGASIFWNYIDLENTTEWQEFKISPKQLPASGTIEIGVGKMQTEDGVSAVMYYDNVAFRNNSKQTNEYESIQHIRQQTTSLVSTDVLKHDEIYFGNVIAGVFWGDLVNYPTFKRCNDATFRPLEEIITQQRLNDFQVYSKTYEANLYMLGSYATFSMANKVYVDFQNLTETDSCLLDAIKYNVKENTYQVRMHIPNNYSDVSSNYRASYVE